MDRHFAGVNRHRACRWRFLAPQTFQHKFPPDSKALLQPSHPVKSPTPSSVIRIVLAFGATANALQADWKDEIGFTRLKALAAADLPTASGTGLAQVEGLESGANYAPNTSSTAFSGKAFTLKSNPSGTSNHANKVATNYYSTSSMLPGSTNVDLYSANGWLGSGFLNQGSGITPLTEFRNVQNHSWISIPNENADPPVLPLPESQVADINRRLDYAIDRDGFVCVVGMNNGASTTLPQLLGQSYHTIAVGRDDGLHSAGLTVHDGSGRIKPDIVAPSASPESATSWTTPMVAGAAGLLHKKLSESYGLTGANRPRLIKALLLASATKDTVPGWDNSAARPLDDIFGAGELNIWHAYQTLLTGPDMSGTTQHGPCGWAATETVSRNSPKTYYFKIPPGAPSTPFCASLIWHRTVPSNFGTSPLANLTLRLHQANGVATGTMLAESSSAVDNVELIYRNALAPGDYALVVSRPSGSGSVPYALAWHSLPAVTVAATNPIAKEIDGQPGVLTFTRTGDLKLPLLVPLTIAGTAIPGLHYQPLPSSVTIPANQPSVSLPVTPIPDLLPQGERNVSVAVAADFALVRDPAQSAVTQIRDKPFDDWRFTKFTPADLANPSIGGETADPDGDGLANLIEYAMGLPPKSPDASPLGILESEGYLAVSGVRDPAASDITWSAQVTGTLDSWSPAKIEFTGETFTARDTLPLSEADQRFIRLKISRP